jgi:hypothetical protein
MMNNHIVKQLNFTKIEDMCKHIYLTKHLMKDLFFIAIDSDYIENNRDEKYTNCILY